MRTPRRRPAVIWPAVLLALSLITLGVLAVRELLVQQGWIEGSPWLTPLLTASATISADQQTVAAGAIALLLGLLLLVLALRPGSKTHRRAPGEVDVWATPDALGHLARDAAERTKGSPPSRRYAQPARRCASRSGPPWREPVTTSSRRSPDR